MDCPIYLGSICVLLEDIGFTRRNVNDTIAPMTYCSQRNMLDKIFADINTFYMVELMLGSKQIMLDRWTINDTGKLFIAEDGLDLNIDDPNSIVKITNFVEESIFIANLPWSS